MDTKMLKARYNSTKGVCCKCGMMLLSTGNPLGDYFVMDNDGNFYCVNCDSHFEDGDERIYEVEKGK